MTIHTAARRAAAALLALTPLLAAGCGGSTGTLNGTVTLGGNPVPKAVVSFVTADGAIHSATTDENGVYTLDGVPTGNVKVTVAPDDAGGEEARTVKKLGGPQAEAAKTQVKFPIPARYADSTQSGLSTTVKAGQNKYDIPLTP